MGNALERPNSVRPWSCCRTRVCWVSSPSRLRSIALLLPEILDEFRDLAYERCLLDNTQQYLAYIRSAGFLGNLPIAATPGRARLGRVHQPGYRARHSILRQRCERQSV